MKKIYLLPVASILFAFIVSVSAVAVIGSNTPEENRINGAGQVYAAVNSVGTQTVTDTEPVANSVTASVDDASTDVTQPAVPELLPEDEMLVVSVSESTAESAVAPHPDEDYAAIERVLSLNRVFDAYLYDESALVEEAGIVLIDKAEQIDGQLVISRQTVDDFIRSLYGRSVDGSLAQGDYYIIAPRGYCALTHRIVSVVRDSRSVTVTSVMTVDNGDESEECTVVTELAPSGTDLNYVVISADIIM